MESNWLIRSAMLLGGETLQHIRQKRVLVVGLGGVGGFAAECLVRAGIRHLTIVDGDHVEASNRNRQLVALVSTEGQNKALALKQRLLDIEPEADIEAIQSYLTEDCMRNLLIRNYDFILDCIDTLAPKISLISEAYKLGSPIISSMGAGGKTDPSRIQCTDISLSYNCTLAKSLRKRLNRIQIRKGVQVVFSPELIDKDRVQPVEARNKRSVIGTISWMPPLFGARCAAYAVSELLKQHADEAPEENRKSPLQ